MNDFDWSKCLNLEYRADLSEKLVSPVATPAQPKSKPVQEEHIWEKGHDVPEGTYLVKLLEIKCHNKVTYKLKVEVLSNVLTGKDHSYGVITGYARRDKYGFYDLANTFSEGVLHKRSTAYIGGVGVLDLTDTGWMTLRGRQFYPELFPDFKEIHSPLEDDNSFESFLKLFK